MPDARNTDTPKIVHPTKECECNVQDNNVKCVNYNGNHTALLTIEPVLFVNNCSNEIRN